MIKVNHVLPLLSDYNKKIPSSIKIRRGDYTKYVNRLFSSFKLAFAGIGTVFYAKT